VLWSCKKLLQDHNISKAVFARNPSQGVSQWKTKVNQNGKIQFGHPPPHLIA